MFEVTGTWNGEEVTVTWERGIVSGPNSFLDAVDFIATNRVEGPVPLVFDHPNMAARDIAASVIEFVFADSETTSTGPEISWEGCLGPRDIRKHPGPRGSALHSTGSGQEAHGAGRISPFNRALHGTENTISALPDTRGLPGKVVKKWEKTTGQSRDQVTEQYRRLITEAMKQPEYEEWRDWYSTAHDIAEGYAVSDGFTVEQSSAIISALSPGMTWEENAETAGELMDLIGEDAAVPAEIVDVLNEKLAIDAAKVGRSQKERREPTVVTEGMKLSEFRSPRDATLALAEIARSRGFNWNAQYGYKSYTNAMLIARDWGTPDTILAGVKTRSFYNNILMPSDTKDVTIDFQMMEAGARRQLTDNEESSLNGTPSITIDGVKTDVGVRPYLADITRDVAKEFDLVPNQAQALIWNQWKREKGQ